MKTISSKPNYVEQFEKQREEETFVVLGTTPFLFCKRYVDEKGDK